MKNRETLSSLSLLSGGVTLAYVISKFIRSNVDKNLRGPGQGRYVGWRTVRRARWSEEMSLTTD